MLATITQNTELTTAIVAIAVAIINAVQQYFATKRSDKHHADSSAAIAAVHTNDVSPSAQNRAIAQAAVAVLPPQPVVLPPAIAQDDVKTTIPPTK